MQVPEFPQTFSMRWVEVRAWAEVVAELRKLSWNSNTLGQRFALRGMRVCCRTRIAGEGCVGREGTEVEWLHVSRVI